MISCKKVFSCIPCLLFVAFTQAQELSTDRPDQSDGAKVVPLHALQLESSFTYNVVDHSTTSNLFAGLFRYGVAQRIELRLGIEQGSNRLPYFKETAHAQYPISIGAKEVLLKETTMRPGISLSQILQVPFSNPRGARPWSVGFAGIVEKELGFITITVNGGAKQEALSSEWGEQFSTDIKYSINDKLDLFTEYFAQFSHDAPFHNADAGICYRLNKRIQLNLAAGTSIDHHPSTYFVNTGAAVRLFH